MSERAQETTLDGDSQSDEPDGDSSPKGSAKLELRPGDHVDRFRVLEVIGEGGMGSVVAAHDEQLDRRVALKFLTRAHRDGVARERIIREARSLARLSHPNIVAVYEVGETEHAPYLAMELVLGQSLRRWLAPEDDTPPPSRLEVLRMFLAIGRGLAAAHEVGVIHRDFKPDNVLVGDEGRARIVDFGLAQLTSSRAAETDGARRELEGGAPVAMSTSSLNQTGALVGTPAYMAPEQWEGLPATQSSDQFAYCTALFQALYGRAPFQAETMTELKRAVLEHEPLSIPSAERVPASLHAAISRGLARDPGARWPSLEPLLDLLEAALATVQPGLITSRPALALRLLLPAYWSLPITWQLLELAGVVEFRLRSWALVSGIQVLMLALSALGLRRVVVEHVGDPRVLGAPLLLAVFIVGHRIIALASGASLEIMFAYDFLAVSGIGGAVTYLVDRRLWVLPCFALLLSALATISPGISPRLWVLFSVCLPLLTALSLARGNDRLREGPSSTRSSLGKRSSRSNSAGRSASSR